MFELLILYLQKELIEFNLVCKKYSENVYYFESERFHLAFDVTLLGDNVAIDIVCRKKFKFIYLIKNKYQNFQGNKVRIFNENIFTDKKRFLDCIKCEFLELTYFFTFLDTKKIYYRDKNNNLKYDEPLKFWFYDAVPNFGDFMSPWLAQHFTNRPVLNVRTHASSDGAILGVGSIVQAVTTNHQNIKIWGSGLISDKNEKNVATKLNQCGLKYVNACRGALTNSFFEKYGFMTSGVLGDPGLLFGNIYTPKITTKYKYAIVPHYIHYDYFKNLNIDDCIIVNVRNDLLDVIDQITSAERVISTSLHGLIISQSYNLPWLHLYVNDGRLLVGEEFKFEDFYSILVRDQVVQQKININEINHENILKLFSKVNCPSFRNNYSESNLIESFFESITSADLSTKEIKKKSNKPNLIFLGDSHINYFKYGSDHGLYKLFDTHTCMASGATILGLNNIKSFTMAGDKFKQYIKKFPASSEILFQLGEVDCGILIWLKAEEKNNTVKEQAQLCIESYTKFIKEIKKFGYENIIITSATLPTINDEEHEGEIISLRRQKVKASFIEITNLTLYFNDLLKDMCERLNVTYIDATKCFLNQSTLLCDIKYRNKNKSDHHMDNIEASAVWAQEINKYLFEKYRFDVKNIKLKCVQDSVIKSHILNSSLLNEDFKIFVKKGDVLQVSSYFEDDSYIYAKEILLNGVSLDVNYKFIFKRHFFNI